MHELALGSPVVSMLLYITYIANYPVATWYAWLNLPSAVLRKPPVIGSSIHFVLISHSDSTFILTCTSTNRPPTYVNWTRNGTQLSDDSIHSLSQSLVDGESSTFHNILTVMGRLPGLYRCQVTTEAWENQQHFTQTATKNLTVLGQVMCTYMAIIESSSDKLIVLQYLAS